MKQGDFSELAKAYHNRPGYSLTVLQVILNHVMATLGVEPVVVDVGAGTGKLTENLVSLGLKITAVEPNQSMREEGQNYTKSLPVVWQAGSGEQTGQSDSSADWILMGSSFHWVDLKSGLNVFSRVLRPGGFFTAVWNPRDIPRSELHSRIERKINELIPNLKRVSSGAASYTADMNQKLISTGQFQDVFFLEAEHEVSMSKERYLGAWRSVNDIQAQAGPELFEKMLQMIESELGDLNEVIVPYKTRAWTAMRIKN